MSNPLKKIMERNIAKLQTPKAGVVEHTLTQQFKDDIKTLKSIEGTPKKIQFKKDRIENYLPFALGLVEGDSDEESYILLYMLVWAMDIGLFDTVHVLGGYVIGKGFLFPETLMRASPATFIGRELINHLKNKTIDEDAIKKIFNLLQDSESDDDLQLIDMADDVRKEIYLAIADYYCEKKNFYSDQLYLDADDLYLRAIDEGASIKGKYRNFLKTVGETLLDDGLENKNRALLEEAKDFLEDAMGYGASVKGKLEEVEAALT